MKSQSLGPPKESTHPVRKSKIKLQRNDILPLRFEALGWQRQTVLKAVLSANPILPPQDPLRGRLSCHLTLLRSFQPSGREVVDATEIQEQRVLLSFVTVGELHGRVVHGAVELNSFRQGTRRVVVDLGEHSLLEALGWEGSP